MASPLYIDLPPKPGSPTSADSHPPARTWAAAPETRSTGAGGLETPHDRLMGHQRRGAYSDADGHEEAATRSARAHDIRDAGMCLLPAHRAGLPAGRVGGPRPGLLPHEGGRGRDRAGLG